MKRLLSVALLAAACATAPPKLAGRYGVVLDPRMTEPVRQAIPSLGDTTLRALRDRLGEVAVVSSPLVAGYDAVIVLRYGGGNLFGPGMPETTLSRFHIVEYEIVRGGASVAKGDVRLGGHTRGEGNERAATASTVNEALAHGIEVARVVTQALESSATPPAARTP